MTGDDHGRAEVYAAELAAYDGTELETVVGFDDLVMLADRVMSEAWWSGGRVAVRRARSDARSSATRHTSRTAIHLAAPQMTRATLIHELAHVLAGVDAGHGALFRRAHVDVACFAFGSGRGRWLEAAYASAGLTLAGRRWPPPDSTRAAADSMELGPIAL